jgi:hypothetical protein
MGHLREDGKSARGVVKVILGRALHEAIHVIGGASIAEPCPDDRSELHGVEQIWVGFQRCI